MSLPARKVTANELAECDRAYRPFRSSDSRPDSCPSINRTGTSTLEVGIDASIGHLLLVTMLAPGPDWLAGRPALGQTSEMAALPDVLEASPLNLARWSPDDVDEVLEAMRSSFAELQQWMDWAQTMPTREQEMKALTEGAAAFDAGTAFGFVFRETATGAVVGGGGVHRRVGPGAVEIGYWVRTDRHHRGYATRAAEVLTDAAFTYLTDVDRIEIHMDCANVASARVPEKLGYRLLRIEPQEQRALGHTGKGYVWEQRRHEWTAQRAREPVDGTR